jgi:hypothetical protein
MSEGAVVALPADEGSEPRVTCTNCKGVFSADVVTVIRWREDGSVAQATCRPCNSACSQLRRASRALKLLSGEDRVEFFRRMQDTSADVKRVFDEMVTVSETHSNAQEDYAEGEYQLVDELKQRSPYKSRPDALNELCKNSFTVTGLDGLERVWVPKYSRKEQNHSGSKATKETQLTSRQAVAKAKAKPKPKAAAKAGAKALADPAAAEPDPLKVYPKATQMAVKKALTQLEKGAKDLQECIFVLSDPTAQDFTSLASVRNGNAMISSCLEYLEKIKKSVTDQVDDKDLKKLTADCDETLKQTKKSYKKLSGHFGGHQSCDRFCMVIFLVLRIFRRPRFCMVIFLVLQILQMMKIFLCK